MAETKTTPATGIYSGPQQQDAPPILIPVVVERELLEPASERVHAPVVLQDEFCDGG